MKPKKISVNPLYPRHPRSINPYADMKTALPQPRFEDAAFEVCHWSLQEIGSVNPQLTLGKLTAMTNDKRISGLRNSFASHS
jgi:hypothetical protein